MAACAVAVAVAVGAAACSEAETPPQTVSPQATASQQGQAAMGGATSGGMAFDLGVDPARRVIRVGLIAELSGPFRFNAEKATQAQLVYWEWLNDRGGISGWRVVPVVRDNAYNVDRHLAAYGELAADGPDSVVMLSASAGTPTTLAALERIERDSLAVVPHSYFSGWSDPAIGNNLFELFASYCIESINGATYMAERFGPRVAVVSDPSGYGADGAEGLMIAAEALGLEVVYDGRGATAPGADLGLVAAAIADANAHWVWLSTGPLATAALIQGAFEAGYSGYWSGNSPSWSPWLLQSEAAEITAFSYIVSARTALWDPQGSPGMREMVEAMRQYRPDAPLDNSYAIGWVQGIAATAILQEAIDRQDLTRAGVLEAARHAVADPSGLAPVHSWSGDADQQIVRETYLYGISVDAIGEAATWEISAPDDDAQTGSQLLYSPQATVSDDAPSNYTLLRGPFISPTAENWQFLPCHQISPALP